MKQLFPIKAQKAKQQSKIYQQFVIYFSARKHIPLAL